LLVWQAAVGLTLCARSMEWPILPRRRGACETAMQREQELFLAQGRNLAKFTEEVIETFNNGFAAFGAEAAQTAARTAHARAQAIPSGAREESYLPDFALCCPWPARGGARSSGD